MCVCACVCVCDLNTLKLFHNSSTRSRLISSVFIHPLCSRLHLKTLENSLSALREPVLRIQREESVCVVAIVTNNDLNMM